MNRAWWQTHIFMVLRKWGHQYFTVIQNKNGQQDMVLGPERQGRLWLAQADSHSLPCSCRSSGSWTSNCYWDGYLPNFLFSIMFPVYDSLGDFRSDSPRSQKITLRLGWASSWHIQCKLFIPSTKYTHSRNAHSRFYSYTCAYTFTK